MQGCCVGQECRSSLLRTVPNAPLGHNAPTLLAITLTNDPCRRKCLPICGSVYPTVPHAARTAASPSSASRMVDARQRTIRAQRLAARRTRRRTRRYALDGRVAAAQRLTFELSESAIRAFRDERHVATPRHARHAAAETCRPPRASPMPVPAHASPAASPRPSSCRCHQLTPDRIEYQITQYPHPAAVVSPQDGFVVSLRNVRYAPMAAVEGPRADTVDLAHSARESRR